MGTLQKSMRSVAGALPAPVRLNIRALRTYLRPIERHRVQRLNELWVKLGRPNVVMQGPFKGMVYPYRNRNILGNHLTNLMGIYEFELHEAVEQFVAFDPDVIVDVGSGEGFYFIGLARRCPKAKVIGFDMSPISRHLLRKNASLNGVLPRLEQREKCEPDSLRAALAGAKRPAVVCDCEGYEDILLNPDAIPELRRAAIIVELHETELLLDPADQFWRSQFDSGVSARIRERFKNTHDILEIPERPRTPADKPPNCALSDAEFLEASTELRGLKGLYFWMRPRAV